MTEEEELRLAQVVEGLGRSVAKMAKLVTELVARSNWHEQEIRMLKEWGNDDARKTVVR